MKRTKKEIKVAKHFNPIPVSFPNKAFGFSELPKSKNILLKNATVWTNEKEGVLKNTDVLIIDRNFSVQAK